MQIDRYELGPVVGTGSFATVYRGRDPRLNAPVAVKVLADNWAADPAVRFRFGQEAALLRRIRAQSRNAPLVDVFDIDEAAGGRPYFVMTFADRGTLASRMIDGVPWHEHDVVGVVEALAQGMSALHTSGVVHRDLKPSNLLYISSSDTAASEELLIGDLGLAKDLLASGSALTIAGGSPGYMAPEQLTGTATITPQADIYSASVIVTELLTGGRGFEGLDLLQPGIAGELERGMSALPPARHGSAPEWAEAVLSALGAGQSAPAPASASASTSVPAADRVAESAMSRSGPSPRALGAAATIVTMAVVAGLMFFGGLFDSLFGGSSSVAVNGPALASVGEPVILSAEVPDGGEHAWIYEDERIVNQDLRVTPRSVGVLEVWLEYVNDDGETISVRHTIEVQP